MVFLFRRKLRSSSVRRIDVGVDVGVGIGIGAGGGFLIDCRDGGVYRGLIFKKKTLEKLKIFLSKYLGM